MLYNTVYILEETYMRSWFTLSCPIVWNFSMSRISFKFASDAAIAGDTGSGEADLGCGGELIYHIRIACFLTLA